MSLIVSLRPPATLAILQRGMSAGGMNPDDRRALHNTLLEWAAEGAVELEWDRFKLTALQGNPRCEARKPLIQKLLDVGGTLEQEAFLV